MTRRAAWAVALCAISLSIPVSAAVADAPVPAAAGAEVAESPAAVPAPAAEPAPVAQPAQSSEDTSGANQYTEPGIPGGEAPAEPTAPEPDPVSPPAATPPATATASQDDAAVTAAPAEDTLPRTGMETAVLALIGLGLLAGGFAVRRMPVAQRPSR